MHTSTAQAIANALRQARRIVIFTGAGMSAESGIATFRGQASSHWQQFKPEELASPDGWRANKQRVWAWYERRRAQVMAAQAHAGHLAIAQLAERLQRLHGREAEDLVDACDAMLVVGTSGVVWPAAELPISAHNLGKFVAEINPEPSGLAQYMRHQWPATAAQGLPQLLDLLHPG